MKATYRFQLRAGFGLRDVRDLLPYLDELGVSDVYLSPIQRARPGSEHGYDGVAPSRIDPELGGSEALEALTAALRDRGMGLLLDIVPNHLATSWDNPWWRDVLEHGPASPYAGTFDVDWACEPALPDRVLLPILGQPYGETLEAGELRLERVGGRIAVRFHEHTFPLDPATWAPLVADLPQLASVVGRIPPRTERSTSAVEQRQAVSGMAHGLLAALSGEDLERLEAALRARMGTPGEPRSWDALDELVDAQAWCLVHWRTGFQRLNYRRFFQITELVGVKVEDEDVFLATHRGLLRLVEEGAVTAVRVDHVDGLYDPEGYLRRLDAALEQAAGRRLPIVVEKILEREEGLRPGWPIAGTTGYDALAALNDLFVDPEGLLRLDALVPTLADEPMAWDDLVYEQKRRTLRRFFAPEIDALLRRLTFLAVRDRHGRDLAPTELRRALEAVTAALPVYRSYVTDRVEGEDLEVVERALAEARRRHPDDLRAVDFVGRVLRLERPPGVTAEEWAPWPTFARKWQQLTGAVMAKGVEDTAFYLYNRLVSLNEVGSDPRPPADPVAAFHHFSADRVARWPRSMTATSTHDTKRSADVRARISVLSELPETWTGALVRWTARATAASGELPDLYLRTLLFQTLLGAWPLDPAELPSFHERVGDYLRKAAREAKRDTTWTDPNLDAEEALLRFARTFAEDPPEDFEVLAGRVAWHGMMNALSQVALSLAMPGVPDVYQGQELWDFSLVDPDNRRPVDYERRRAALALVDAPPAELRERWRDGRIKLRITQRLLRERRLRPDLFLDGGYLPLRAEGEHAHRVVAFARRQGPTSALVVAPRLTTGLVRVGEWPLGEVWGDTRLVLPEGAPRAWRDALAGGERRTGPSARLAELLVELPVALWIGGTE